MFLRRHGERNSPETEMPSTSCGQALCVATEIQYEGYTVDQSQAWRDHLSRYSSWKPYSKSLLKDLYQETSSVLAGGIVIVTVEDRDRGWEDVAY